MPRSLAIFAHTINNCPNNSASESCVSSSDTKCRLGITKTCTAACGFKSQGQPCIGLSRSMHGLKVDRASVSKSIVHRWQGRSCIGLKVDRALVSRSICSRSTGSRSIVHHRSQSRSCIGRSCIGRKVDRALVSRSIGHRLKVDRARSV